jgi:Na+-transporting NADH:ubiquinone oxidoreductase subunit NqrF
MSEPHKSSRPWAGETGVIRRELLERYLPDLTSPIYYFAGPPAMTMAMHELLDSLGVAERSMRYEEFYGY